MNLHRVTNLLRSLFVIFCASIGSLMGEAVLNNPLVGGAGGLIFGLLAVLLDRLLHGVSLRAFSSATIGLLMGLVAAQLLRASDILRYQSEHVEWSISILAYAVFGYFGMMLAMRSSRDEFAILIPYVRFARQSVQDVPLLLDTNIIIDGRLPEVCATGFLSSSVVVPNFIIDEMQKLADSADSLKREKGRRGLTVLTQMQSANLIEVTIHHSDLDEMLPVDTRLLQVAQILGARLLTNDSNLCKVARIKGVIALNLDELTLALSVSLQVGDLLELTLSKEGRDAHQAVGYLSDGTMIVVNHARELIGKKTPVRISSVVKTGAGRLFFAELENADA